MKNWVLPGSEINFALISYLPLPWKQICIHKHTFYLPLLAQAPQLQVCLCVYRMSCIHYDSLFWYRVFSLGILYVSYYNAGMAVPGHIKGPYPLWL